MHENWNGRGRKTRRLNKDGDKQEKIFILYLSGRSEEILQKLGRYLINQKSLEWIKMSSYLNMEYIKNPDTLKIQGAPRHFQIKEAADGIGP